MTEQDEERWVPVLGWDGFYEVSDLGRVRSVSRIAVRRGKTYDMPGRVLRPLNVSGGRYAVSLCADGNKARRMIHHLVLEAFVGRCPQGMECCHRDDDSANNRLSNLRWDTRSANELDKLRNGNHYPGSLTHCKHGHEFTPENTKVTKRGRECITCRRRHIREYMQRRRAEIAADHSRCGQCGKPREFEKYRLCNRCRERVREHSRRERARRAPDGRCTKCGKQRDSNFFKICSSCRDRERTK